MTDIPYKIEPDTLIVQTSPGVTAEMGDHLVMLSIDQGAYFDMNPTAKLIWESLASPRTLHELCMLIHDEYDVSEQQCRVSVERFIFELHKENMISFQTLAIRPATASPIQTAHAHSE